MVDDDEIDGMENDQRFKKAGQQKQNYQSPHHHSSKDSSTSSGTFTLPASHQRYELLYAQVCTVWKLTVRCDDGDDDHVRLVFRGNLKPSFRTQH